MTIGGNAHVNRIKTSTVAVLLASFIGVQPAPAHAAGHDRRDGYERRWDRDDDRHGDDRREHRRERREERRERRRQARHEARDGYWDPAPHYRHDDRRYRARKMRKGDRIYRGSDDRYYCKRDDGTTGLIVGGITGGVLGHVIAPGGSKTVGAIIGAGTGALIGRAIDQGDLVCR